VRTLRLVTAASAAAILVAVLAVVAFAAPSSIARSAAPMGSTIGQYGAAAPDLGVVLVLNPSVVVTGDGLTLTATVRNKPERGGADSVTLTIEVPDSLEVVSTSSNRGPGKCTGTSSLRCFLDFMSPIHVGIVNVELRAKTVGSATIAARVASNQKDENAADNSASAVLTVRAPATPGSGGTTGQAIAGTSRADTIVGTAKADRLSGGAGNDRISGGGGNDRVDGGPGNDTLNGGPGNDQLTGGPGQDRISGGPGNDTILARDRARDTIDCGSGRDTVVADRVDSVARDCESIKRR
jgi:Ca2+-binding RTX toxin-like protein